MPVDFHSHAIKGTYASRTADTSWKDAMLAILDPRSAMVADIGCGGGIYTRAWAELGARSVTGVDFSPRMVDDAAEHTADLGSVQVLQGDATATPIPDGTIDVVFSRAVIHHLPDIGAAFDEAFRILSPGGTIIVQDRTIEDVQKPASAQHLRGWFFELFPHLMDIEAARRPAASIVNERLEYAGFSEIGMQSLFEFRRRYESARLLRDDLRARTGRSILHELDDDKLESLIEHVVDRVTDSMPLEEGDYWTVWSARKPID